MKEKRETMAEELDFITGTEAEPEFSGFVDGN